MRGHPTGLPHPVHVSNHSSQVSYSVSFRDRKSGEDDSKTKTVTVTEDCTATDDVESSTSIVEVPSTQVTESLPTVTVTKKITRVEWVSTKSLHKPKHTKHHWTETEVETEVETETVAPTTIESTETHTKHHKSKHHKSKHHKSKHHTKHHSSEIVETTEVIESPSSTLSVSETSSEFEETSLPTSSHSITQTSSFSVPQTSAESSVKEEVVVITTEEVKVVTTGYEEVVSTITLSEGDSRLSTLTKPTSTGSSSLIPSTPIPWFEPDVTSDPGFNPFLWPHGYPTETSSVPASSLYSHYNPHMTRHTREWFNPPRETPEFGISPPHTSTETSIETSFQELVSPKFTFLIPPAHGPPHQSEIWSSYFNPSVTTTADDSEETSMLTSLSLIPVRGPTLNPSETSSTSVTAPADNTTRTRSGHKTKEPPSIIPAETPSSSSFTDIKFTITHGPDYPVTETSIDNAIETLFASANNGDPQKKHDKYLKPDKAMSKRMSRWSKHYSHRMSKNWSHHTKYQVSSLAEQMEYDSKQSRKHHKTTLDAPAAAMITPAAAAMIIPAAAANNLLVRDDDDEDPEYEYSKEMKKASKQYNKIKDKADKKYSKQHSKELKKSAKQRAKSIAKEQKEYEKSSKKAMKSRIKHQGDHDYVAVEPRAEEDVVAGTPVSVPAVATVTATTVTIGGGGVNGTLSTSWRTKHATKTATITDGY
jgi:hypothetical protein